MKLTTLGPAPDRLFAVFYDPSQIGCEAQQHCRDTQTCRLLGFTACPANFLRTERVIAFAVEEMAEGGTKVVTLIGGTEGPRVAEYLPHFLGVHHKGGVGRDLCDHAITLHERSAHGIDGGSDSETA